MTAGKMTLPSSFPLSTWPPCHSFSTFFRCWPPPRPLLVKPPPAPLNRATLRLHPRRCNKLYPSLNPLTACAGDSITGSSLSFPHLLSLVFGHSVTHSLPSIGLAASWFTSSFSPFKVTSVTEGETAQHHQPLSVNLWLSVFLKLLRLVRFKPHKFHLLHEGQTKFDVALFLSSCVAIFWLCNTKVGVVGGCFSRCWPLSAPNTLVWPADFTADQRKGINSH